MTPNRRADRGYAVGRRAKALQFLNATDEIMDLADDAAEFGDAFVTPCAQAGIAAADVTPSLVAEGERRSNSRQLTGTPATRRSSPRAARRPGR